MIKTKECKKIMKVCNTCGKLKGINDFYKHKGNSDGYRNQCKECFYNRYVHICPICNKKFRSSRKAQIYCSHECTVKGQTGEGNPFYNHKHLEKTKIKISCSRKGKCAGINHFLYGKHRSEEVKKKLHDNHIGRFTGKDNPNYNFNISDEERIIGRNYHEYNVWRENVYKRDKYTCKCCGSNKSGNLVAHHIKNYSSYKEGRTDVNNGITLCDKCHRLFHNTYGYTNNTKEQLIEFIKLYNIKEA